MKNVPYVKKYDKDGKVTNPIIGGYLHDNPNRQARRVHKNKFFGNGKNLPLTVLKTGKYLRHIQHEFEKTGEIKKIYHYLPL